VATKEFLEERAAKAQEKIGKIEKRILRLRKELAMGKSLFGESDLRQAERDLVRAQEKLAEYQKQLTLADMKKASRNVPAITEFLNRWEQNMIAYFEAEFQKFITAQKVYFAAESKYTDWWNHGKGFSDPNRKKIEEDHRALRERFIHTWRHITQFGFGRHYYENDHEYWTSVMRKEMAKEKDRKYDFIIERTTQLIGQITDASLLGVGAKGDLNGYIKGTNGTAHVQTIGAGGWNIQCFHFRTLINKIK